VQECRVGDIRLRPPGDGPGQGPLGRRDGRATAQVWCRRCPRPKRPVDRIRPAAHLHRQHDLSDVGARFHPRMGPCRFGEWKGLVCPMRPAAIGGQAFRSTARDRGLVRYRARPQCRAGVVQALEQDATEIHVGAGPAGAKSCRLFGSERHTGPYGCCCPARPRQSGTCGRLDRRGK
jgi:hypothetical protein